MTPFAKKLLASAIAVVATAGLALAQPGPGMGSGYGGGMMGGGGPGMMYGYGGGMMGGGGPGMMRGYGGGIGPGAGMWQGPGGWHHGGPGGFQALELTPDQRDKIDNIVEEAQKKNWNTMGQMRSEMFKLHRLYRSDKLDANVIDDQQKKIDELRRQMLRSRIETHNQIDAILTPEQRKRHQAFGPRWMRDDE